MAVWSTAIAIVARRGSPREAIRGREAPMGVANSAQPTLNPSNEALSSSGGSSCNKKAFYPFYPKTFIFFTIVDSYVYYLIKRLLGVGTVEWVEVEAPKEVPAPG